jgi:trehalose/maltose hydrolase-like predicted phosphorylase
VQSLHFRLTVRGQQLAVAMEAGNVTYTLERGDGLTIYHVTERLDLRPGEPVHRS